MKTNRFDQAARNWDKKTQRHRLARAVARAILGLPLKPGTRAMEYGCGTGLVALEIAPHVASLTCIDTSTGMLEVLGEKLRDTKTDNVHPLCLDLTQEPYSERFDLIFCSMTLHHIPEPTPLIGRFTDLLAPDGFLAIADLDLEDGSFHGPNTPGVHHLGFDRRQLTATFVQTGLTDIHHETVFSFEKDDEQGRRRSYSIFFISGKKDSLFQPVD